MHRIGNLAGVKTMVDQERGAAFVEKYTGRRQGLGRRDLHGVSEPQDSPRGAAGVGVGRGQPGLCPAL